MAICAAPLWRRRASSTMLVRRVNLGKTSAYSRLVSSTIFLLFYVCATAARGLLPSVVCVSVPAYLNECKQEVHQMWHVLRGECLCRRHCRWSSVVGRGVNGFGTVAPVGEYWLQFESLIGSSQNLRLNFISLLLRRIYWQCLKVYKTRKKNARKSSMNCL